MKFYIASHLENSENVRKIAQYLTYQGWDQTYDWTAHGLVDDKKRLVSVSLNEIQGVRDADVVFLLLPGERGTHAELGAAIAYEKPVVILALDQEDYHRDGHTCVFYWHPVIFDRIIEPDILTLAFTALRAAKRIVRRVYANA